MGNVHLMPTSQNRIAQQKPKDCIAFSQEIMEHENDIFRDSFLRYLGYANDVGEALKRKIPRKLYFTSYAITSAYVCADVIQKGMTAMSIGHNESQSLVLAGDAFVWQLFSSIIIPGYVINSITVLTRRLVRLKRKKCICKAPPVVRYLPLAVGLLSIPLICHPIDKCVTWAMDQTIRNLYSKPKS